jgi:hypothetical protein
MGIVQFPLICLDTLKKHGSKIVLTGAPTGELFQNMMALGIIEYVEAWEALIRRSASTGDILPMGLLAPQLVWLTAATAIPLILAPKILSA